MDDHFTSDISVEKIIRAKFDENSITIYQAYNREIANEAIKFQKFISPQFKKERMTWIKPSFLWMMYRSGWARKENQEYILAIKINRKGFEWALKNSCLSHFDKSIYKTQEEWKTRLQKSPVRLQWDPEKNILLEPQSYKSIQIGLSGIAVEKYINEWIIEIKDITEYCKKLHHLLRENKSREAKDLLPIENVYPLPKNIQLIINSNYSSS